MTDLNTMTPLACSECSEEGTYEAADGVLARCVACGHEVNNVDMILDEGEHVAFDSAGQLCVVRPDMVTCSWCTDEVPDDELVEQPDGARICDECVEGLR